MIESPYTVRLLHEDKVREAMKHSSNSQLIRDISEPVPNVYEEGLLPRIRQWISSRRNRPTEAVTDVRRAPALKRHAVHQD